MADPPNADDPWTGRDPGTYVHTCHLPAEWIPGALWRCYEGHLWTVDTACGTCRWLGKGEGGARHVCTVGLAWWPATWWQRLLAVLRGDPRPVRQASLGMANGNRVQGFPNGAPGGPSTPDYDG